LTDGKRTDPILAEFIDFLPHYGMLPSLSAEDVQRWQERGREGAARTRAGDLSGAEAAYRTQIAIYPVSPEPYLALAFLHAGSGKNREAMTDLRAAVVRGFLDLQRFSRAEAATRVRKSMELLELEDAIPRLQKAEDDWAGWDSFRVDLPPVKLADVLGGHARWHEDVAMMAPVLGPRQTRLWKRVIDRSTAVQLEAYVTKTKGAADIDEALARLMAIYAQGPTLRWEPPPAEAAKRLSEIAGLVLARGADHPLRAGALACGAVAQSASRDEKGVLRPASASWIETSLGEILSRYKESGFAELAAIGLVRTQAEAGRMDRAAATYVAFREAHASDAALLARVRDGLGELSLRAGGLPSFRAEALDGAVVTPESLRGKVTVLDFWATWCRPCVDGFPTLQRLQTKHGERINVVGVSLDDMPGEDLRAWLATEKVTGRHIQEGAGWESEVVRQFGVKEIPFSVVVGADGTVLAVNAHGKGLEKAVAAALSSP
jgi:thiol-disulfide isomerase/thioredoxin